MKFLPLWIVWILACISFALCQDETDIGDVTKSSILSEVSKLLDSQATSSQRPSSTVREEQIEDELSNGATTTEKFIERRKFLIRPTKEYEEYREIFTAKSDESGPTTVRSVASSSTSRSKVSFSSTLKKYEGSEDVTNGDSVDFTTTFDGLTKKSTADNGERKTRQRLDGLKGVTTNRGKTRFQNEQATSEIPDLLATLRHKKPIRVKPVDQILREDVVTTSAVDDSVDVTTVVQDNSEFEQLRPKFKKPPLIATHHPNFGTSTETSRRPAIRSNLNLKQKISASTNKIRPTESDVTEPENTTTSNKTFDIVSSNVQLNKIRPVKVIAQKGTTIAQQPIPPTATAWALASLKAPNTTNKILRKPSNVTNSLEQVSKIKPFVTWSTRLQKINEDNSSTTSSSITESKELSTGAAAQHVSSSEPSNNADRFTPEITSTESLIHIVSTSPTDHVPNRNDSAATVVGGDTDQNKYEVYGSQKPDVENAKTIIETLRPSSSTTPSESQNSKLLLVTSYKSILENNNTSDGRQDASAPSETPVSENILKKEVAKDASFSTMMTEQSSVDQHSEEMPPAENVRDHEFPVMSTSTEMFSKTPGLLFDYSEYHDINKVPTTTTNGVQPSSSDVTFSFSHGIDFSKENHSTTTEQYIESIKTKLDDKITESTTNRGLSEMDDFIKMFSLDRPVSSSTEGTETASAISEKTTVGLSLPTNEISNASQAPSWPSSPDTFFTDFDSNSTDSHDEADDGQKTFESSSQSSTAVNEPTSDYEISENDVPVIITTSSTPTTTTTTTTTTPMPVTTTTTTTTTPRPTTSTTTTSRPTTTTTTTPSPTTTTTTTSRPTTTTTTTSRPTTTTTTTPRPTTTTTTTPSPTTITTTTPRPTTTPKPITTTTTTTTTTITPKTSTTTTTTPKPITTTTSIPITITTTTSKPNSITSRPKPAVVDFTSTTLRPNAPIIPSYLKALVNSTLKSICESEDELKDSIIKLFESGTERVRTKNQIQFLNVNEKNCQHSDDDESPVNVEFYLMNSDGEYNLEINKEFMHLLDNHRFVYKSKVIEVSMKRFMESENSSENETENPRVKTAVYLSCIAGVCTLLVLILLFIRKRQKRFNYGQRCTPETLDDYSMDNISVYNSVRRKGALRASKRSYGNPAFDDSSAVSHSLNFAGLVSFSEDRPAIDEEFSNVPVITVKPDELPPGAETKNRYANVIPLPETRVMLNPRSSAGHNSDYINANFVKGYKGADKFYIACQAPMQSTLPDFWQMIWEQNTRVIMMVTSLTEKGVERCADYLPPSEVVDCHRLFGDYQVTLKKREVKEKFIISSLQLKNLETNLWRDVTHLWYGGWPVQGVPSDPGAMLAFLMEARSHMKTNSGPHVVHCSPGTGRTGTVIACDIAIREFELSRNVDVPKTVYAVRRCRAGAVQTRDQYALIYKVVSLYASKLSGGVWDSI